ncbi:MAG: diphthamide biosynthesis enzyme Dph2 [Candidatus Micrarchaeia archaeon]
MKVLLQFPEGLKQYALEYAKTLEKEGNEVIVSASPSFGACDLAIEEAKKIGAEKLIHFGHAEFMHASFNVEYVEYRIDADLSILEKSIDVLKPYKKIGIVTTVQHIGQLEEIKRFYEKNGKEVYIGKPNMFAKYKGQILGCDPGSASSIDSEVDAHIYFGGGLFHPLGAVYTTKKPFFAIDPFAKKIESLDMYREKRRGLEKAMKIKSLKAKTFGILVSTKTGQYNIKLAEMIKNKLAKNGLYGLILTANTFDFDSLNNMLEIDAFINTACPRIVTDDYERLRKPILSPAMLEEFLYMIKDNNKSER